MLERNEILLTLASGTGLAAQIQFCVKIQETTGWLVYLWHLVSHEDYIVDIAIKQELKLILIIRCHISQFYLHNPAMDSINPSRIEKQLKDFTSLTQHCITPNNIIPKRHWNIIENPTWELFTKKAKEKEKKTPGSETVTFIVSSDVCCFVFFCFLFALSLVAMWIKSRHKKSNLYYLPVAFP